MSKKNSAAPTLSRVTPRPHFHGRLRSLDTDPSLTLFERRFGRMFRTLPAAKFYEEDLAALGEEMVAVAEDEVTPETQADAEENIAIPAGFTYLGQFIDHDLTFDPISSLEKQNDPDALTDFRSPRFDLDSVYGRGPADQPFLDEDDGRHLQLSRRLTGAERFDPNVRDLPRHKSEPNPAKTPPETCRSPSMAIHSRRTRRSGSTFWPRRRSRFTKRTCRRTTGRCGSGRSAGASWRRSHRPAARRQPLVLGAVSDLEAGSVVHTRRHERRKVRGGRVNQAGAQSLKAAV